MFTITATANEKSEQMLPVKTENFILKEYLLNNANANASISRIGMNLYVYMGQQAT